MKKGDKVKTLKNHPCLGVTNIDVGIVISKDEYKIPDQRGSRSHGCDVEVKFGHVCGTFIFQGYELLVIGEKNAKR